MSDTKQEEVVALPGLGLPAEIGSRIPQKYHGVARELLDLPSRERRKILRAMHHNGSGGERTLSSEMRVEASMWQGPLPSPDQLARFDAVVPGAAERLIKMAENQQDHRIKTEKFVIENQVVQSKRGQVCGLIIGLCGIGLSGLLAYWKMEMAAGSVGGITLGGLAIAFITGKAQEKQSRADKK